MSIFKKFNDTVDMEGLKKDMQEVEEKGTDYKEAPPGEYEVTITKLEPNISKNGRPMVTVWMKILDGEYKNSMLFYNQVIDAAFGLHKANEFLRSLDSGLEIEFVHFEQYEQLLLDVHEAIDQKLEYAVEYGQKKGFGTFKINEVFEVNEVNEGLDVPF